MNFRPVAEGPDHPAPRESRFTVPGGVAVTIFLTLAAIAAAMWIPDLETPARLALAAFGCSIVWWTTTSISPGLIALAAAAFLMITGVLTPAAGWEAATSGAVGLVAAAFVIGAAIHQCGLAGRMTRRCMSGAKTVNAAAWRLTGLLTLLAWLIPSTSARAALALPVHRAISSGAGPDAGKISRAFSLIAPAAILTSTIVSLTGAGSHLVANDLLHHASGERISFAKWIVYGLPFGVLATAATVAAALFLFLDRRSRGLPLDLHLSSPAPWSRIEISTAAILAIALLLWMTTAWHGIPIAAVAVAAAVIFALPKLGPLTWRKALGSVSWNLVAFVAGALALGNALISTGAAAGIVGWKLETAGFGKTLPWYGALLPLAVITLTSHLYITSHIARTAAIMPPLLAASISAGLDPVAVTFIATVGMNFCLTFPVSSKALLMFQNAPGGGFTNGDLLRLAAVSGTAHLILIGVFHLTYWKWTGLTL